MCDSSAARAMGVVLLIGACSMERAPLLADVAGAGGSGAATGPISTRDVPAPVLAESDDWADDPTPMDPPGAHDPAAMSASECDATSDASNGGCAADAHCSDGSCVPDRPPGADCSHDGQCSTDHCDNGHCCSDGACCTAAAQCPGHDPDGTPTCLDPGSCSGERTEVVCGDDFRCETIVTPDESACEGEPRSCGRYASVVCPAQCPDACVDDAECAPETPCVDGVCCEADCAGTCETCNRAGECVPIAEGQDPADECGGLRCDDYYAGWFGTACLLRAPADATQVACDGAGACQRADAICPSRPPGAVVGACQQRDCAQPVPGTCTGMTPGVCFMNPSCQP